MILGAAFLAVCVVGIYLFTILCLEQVETWLISRRRARQLRRYAEIADKYHNRPPGEG